jgi:hypothetical protein
VFTCAFANAGARPEEYRDNRECRAFDYERYSASFLLEGLVRALETRKCYFAGNQNFFTTALTAAPAGKEYRVFFSVRPDRTAADTVTLFVQSAYFGRIGLRPRGQRAKEVRFKVLLSNTLQGKALREPPR